MLGLDVDKIVKPFIEVLEEMNESLARVIELLEEVSEKLDNN